MKMTLICMKMKLHAELIFIWMVSHLDSFWNRGTRELENSLFYIYREDLLIDIVNTRQALSRFFTLNYRSKRRQNDFVIFYIWVVRSTWLPHTNVFLITCPDRVAQKVLSTPSEKQWFSYILFTLVDLRRDSGYQCQAHEWSLEIRRLSAREAWD